MKTIDKTKPIMVTGATGYVAGWIIKKLLEDGITVHAAVRNPDNKEKLKYLNQLAEKTSGKIKYFKADLLQNASYEEAMKDCELVYHTASPFINSVKDPQRDLIDPALLGTRNVLDSVNKTESVKRVVLTSSCAAVIGDTIDLLDLPGGIADEENWNTTSNLKHQAYSYSKTLAEKEAWKMNEEQGRWDLVVINPTLVLGPGINPISTSESFNLIKQMGDGSMKMGAPGLDIGVVDVRNVADAHINAGFLPKAKGRHIISNTHKTFLQLAEMLRPKYGDSYPLPKKELPKFLVWLVGPLQGIKRKMVSRNFGYQWLVDNSKSKKALGIKYIPIEKTMEDFFQQMIDNGVFNKK
ncbi:MULTISPECIES: NAD-dependent epimerase/dehydratase family protein [unclassified Lentimicrobium]|uniref:NAD-dependent epimerase/dehydratase family protein n=1 Tax=unclassified Lentimicrobium TaxID=2677434 RepID=UPI00155341C9|nr:MULTISPECIES: NAD-dependent epimerase/dehydratase family protein [unclassified Lentimicrobium]NPD47086.1 NAD-dependent epimerase/dehydratase family protein [Lentimicrobium sp. S6]NPD85734.1 NAD-dependent epimerase/dehydratase family protein [Lentimicrobium sp. L6]